MKIKRVAQKILNSNFKNSPGLLRLLPARGREAVLALNAVFQRGDDQSGLVGLGAAVAEEPCFVVEKRREVLLLKREERRSRLRS